MRRLVTIDLRHADVDAFEAYEAKVLPLVGKHGGRLEWRLRAADGSGETHLLYFPDTQGYEAFRADPGRQAAQHEWRSCGAISSAVDADVVQGVEPVAGSVIDHDWAADFARQWIDAWNAADLDQILAHYVEDFEMSSPLILDRMGVPSGRLRGKRAIRAYWAIGLATLPPLQFELLDVLCGIDVVAIYYRSATRGRRVVERLRFNKDRLAVSAEAIYREDL